MLALDLSKLSTRLYPCALSLFGELAECSPICKALTAEDAPIIIVGDYEWEKIDPPINFIPPIVLLALTR